MSRTITLVSRDAASAAYSLADISGDGRYVTYLESDNGAAHSLSIVDTQTGATQLIATSFFVGESLSYGRLSADGQFVAFTVNGDTNSQSFEGLFVWERATGTSQQIAPTSHFAISPRLSHDGGYVIFESESSDLVPGDTNGLRDLFQANVQTGAVQRLYEGQYEGHALSADGRYVTVAATTQNGGPILRLDLQTGATTLIGDNTLGQLSLSGDGRFAVFSTYDALLPEDTNGDRDVYLKDLSTGALRLVSTSTTGAIIDGNSDDGVISADGSRVAFITDATNLTDFARVLAVKDLATGILTLVAPGDGTLSVSADGLVIGFTSEEALGINDTDAQADAYVVRFYRPELAITTVSGDNLVHAGEGVVIVRGTSDAIGRDVLVTSPSGDTNIATVLSDGTWSTFVGVDNVTEGTHAFTAYVLDNAGVRGDASQSVVFDYTLTNTLGAVASDDIVSPSELSAVIFSGSTDGDSVALSIDNVVIGHPDVQPDGTWFFFYNGAYNGHTIADGHLDDGQHEMEVSTADAAGNVNTRSTFFDVHGPTAIPVLHFGGGIVTTDFGGQDIGNGVALQPDGKIRVAGQSFGVSAGNAAAQARYNTDGSLDGTFGDDGKATTQIDVQFPFIAVAAVFQPDGKVVLAGDTSSDFIGGAHYVTSLRVFALFRSNADGSPDTSFGAGGTVLTDFVTGTPTPADAAYTGGATVQADGKIVVVGTITSGSGGTSQLAVARYNTDGSLDTHFGNGDGKVTTQISSNDIDGAVAVAVQPDGKIVVLGGTNDPVTGYDFTVVRYNADGSLDVAHDNPDSSHDPGFGGGDGFVTTNLEGTSSFDVPRAVALQADGKILAVGEIDSGIGSRFAIVRYNTDGSLDTTFDHDGIATLSFEVGSSTGVSVTTQPDGEILVARLGFGLVRFNADGSLDTHFGNGTGQVTTDIAGFGDGVAELLLQPDGKILAAGTSRQSFQNEGGDTDFALVRYNADGSLDQTFGETVYLEHGAPVILDHHAFIHDPEYFARNGGLGDFAGAQLTVARHGGPDAQDVFGASGRLAFDGLVVLLDGTAIGAQTQADGTLTITFGPDVTQDEGNAALRALSYATTYGGPSTEIGIDWTLSNPNVHPVVSALALGGTTGVRIVSEGSNAPPTGTSATITTFEDTARAFTAADFGFHDTDAADTLHAVRIDTLPLAGTLVLGGAAVTAGQIIQASDIPALDFQSAANENGAAYATFTFSVSDGTDFATAPDTLTIDVTAVNDPPVAGLPVKLTAIDENSGARLIAQAELLGNAKDVDGPSLTATGLAIASGGGTLADNHNGTWSYTPATGDDTSVSFSYVVSDGIAPAVSTIATLDILPPSQTIPITTGTPGNDDFTAGAGNQGFDAGLGDDTIHFNFRLVDASISYAGNKVIVDTAASHTVLSGFEKYVFTDGTVNNNDNDPLVDDLFYYSHYHDVWNAHADADQHYHQNGWHEGRDPDAFFSTMIYLSADPDVKAAGVDPLIQFDQFGWKEGRVPSVTFDDAKYLAANPDVAAAHVDPLAHFLAFGAQEGRQPFAPSEIIAANGFDYVYYLQHNPDVAAAGVDPFQHFETTGWKEGRNPNALFDVNGYLATYTDVAAAGVNPLDHYAQFGWHEGRDPSVNFDTTDYLSHYADVAAAHVNPLVHFLQFGINEGRSAFADGVWG